MMALQPQVGSGSIYGHRLEERQIRLMKILPADSNSRVRIQMIESSIDEPDLVYYALSYTWGNPACRVEVECNGQPTSITENLFDALCQLRENSFEQLLWADAICINQEDLVEKTSQVRMMRRIFAQATLVFVWLGKATDSDEYAFQLLQRISRFVVDPSDPDASLNSYLDFPSIGLPSLMDGQNISDQWSALAQFLDRPWFGRLWILQEYIVAQEVLFLLGPLKIDGKLIFHLGVALSVSSVIRYAIGFIGKLKMHRTFNGATAAATLAIMRQDFRSEKALDFSVAISSTIQRECTHHVDKVFGIAGLVSAIPDTFVDYTKDVSQVLLDTAILCINEPPTDVNDRYLIFSVCDPQEQNPDLPSWVPSWKTNHKSTGLLGIKWIANLKHNKPSSPIVNDDHSLRCRGKIIDKISCIVRSGPPSDLNGDLGNETVIEYMKNFTSWLADVDTMFSRESDATPAATGLEEMLCRLLCFDSNTHGGKAGQTEQDQYLVFRSWVRDWSSAHGLLAGDKPQTETSKAEAMEARARIEEAESHFEGIGPFIQTLDFYGAGRHICLTELGYCCWVFTAAEVGDHIAVLYGAATPFVLRQRGESSWSLKGECFIQGLMEVDPEDMACVETDIVIV